MIVKIHMKKDTPIDDVKKLIEYCAKFATEIEVGAKKCLN